MSASANERPVTGSIDQSEIGKLTDRRLGPGWSDHQQVVIKVPGFQDTWKVTR